MPTMGASTGGRMKGRDWAQENESNGHFFPSVDLQVLGAVM